MNGKPVRGPRFTETLSPCHGNKEAVSNMPLEKTGTLYVEILTPNFTVIRSRRTKWVGNVAGIRTTR
jgi:hypothetical protein